MSALFWCPECGPQKKMLFDASTLLERQFEGMFFDILPDAGVGDGFKVQGQPQHAEYLEDFNMKKLLKQATEIVADPDDRSSIYCPTCQEPLE